MFDDLYHHPAKRGEQDFFFIYNIFIYIFFYIFLYTYFLYIFFIHIFYIYFSYVNYIILFFMYDIFLLQYTPTRSATARAWVAVHNLSTLALRARDEGWP